MTPTFKVSSGYDSDTSLTIRKRQSLSPLSLAEQKLAYKNVQKGGDVPLNGLRKPAPERPKDVSQNESTTAPSVTPIEIRQPNSTRICVHQKRVSRPSSSTSFSSMVTSRCTRSLSSLSTTKRFQSPRCVNLKINTSSKTGNVGFIGNLNSSTKHPRFIAEKSHYEKERASTSGMSSEKSKEKGKLSSFTSEKKLQSMKICPDCRCIDEVNSRQISADVGDIKDEKQSAVGAGNVARRRKVNYGAQKLSRNHKRFQDPREVRPCVQTFVTAKKKSLANVTCPQCFRTVTTRSVNNKKTNLSEKENTTAMKFKISKSSNGKNLSSRSNQVEPKSRNESRCSGNFHSNFQVDSREISKESKNDTKLTRRNDRSYKILAKSAADFPACLAIEKTLKNSDETSTKKFFIKILHAGAVVKDCTNLHVGKPNRNVRKENLYDASKGIVAVSVNCQKMKRKSHELLSRKSSYLNSGIMKNPSRTIIEKTFTGKECPLKSLITNELIKTRKCKGKIQNVIAMPLQIPETIQSKRFLKTQKFHDPSQFYLSKNELRNLENGIKKKKYKKAVASSSNSKDDGLHRAYEIFLNNSDFNEICLYQRHSSKNLRPIEFCHRTPKKSFVYERVIRHHEKMKESLKFKPLRKSCSMYLAYKQPVSKSIFKSHKFESSSTFPSSKDVWCDKLNGQISAISQDDHQSYDSDNQRQIPSRHLASISRCKEQKIPYTLTLSPRRSVYRSIKASKQRQDVYGSSLSKKETEKRKIVVGGTEEKRDKSFLFETEATTSKSQTISQYPQSINRKYYLLDLASYQKKLSEKFNDLYDFYTTLESMNELQTMSSSDLLTRPKDENIRKRTRLREKLEEELDSLYSKLKSFQKDKNFLFATKDVDKLRWKGDCSLRCKRQSVENMLQYFQGLERDGKTSKGQAEVHFQRDSTRKSLRRGHSMYNITNTPARSDETKNFDATHSRRHDQEKKCWRSLSVEQVAALKSQLETIYSNKHQDKQKSTKQSIYKHHEKEKSINLPIHTKAKSEIKSTTSKKILQKDTNDKVEFDTSNFEVVVPSQFGEDIQDSQKNLYVRCHSVTSPDDFKKSMTSLDRLDRSDKKSSLKKSDSISYGGEKVETIKLENNVPCPPAIYGSDRKTMSLTLTRDTLNLATTDFSLPSTSQQIDRDMVNISKTRSPDSKQCLVTDDPSKDFYSLEVFYDEGISKSGEQSTLLLGVKRDNEEVQSFHSERAEESGASIITATRDLTLNETDDIIQRKQAWTKMINLQNSCLDYVPRKIEFFESAARSLDGEKGDEEQTKNPGKSSRLKKSLHSQSFTDLKDLFGETKVPRYVGLSFPDYADSPTSMEEISIRRRSSHELTRRIGDVPPKWMYSWPRNDEYDERHRDSSSPTQFRSVSLCGCEVNSDRCLRDYFKFVNNGTVRRLRDYFECTGNFCRGENGRNLMSKRFRSDPELTRSTMDFSVYENVSNIELVSCPRIRNESTELLANVINTITELKSAGVVSANGNENILLETK